MIKLSQRQEQILYGIILGDGYLQSTGKTNARLRLEHGKKQKDYLFWKADQFKKLFQGKPVYIERIHPKTKKKYGYWRYQSNSSPILGKFRKIFYPQGKKMIPSNLDQCLTPLILAIWYMDDGYYNKRDRSCYLYLGRVLKKEAEIVSSAIEKMFNLPNKILDKKLKGYVIYFSPRNVSKLIKIIEKHILFQFNYKIPSNPVTTDPLLAER